MEEISEFSVPPGNGFIKEKITSVNQGLAKEKKEFEKNQTLNAFQLTISSLFLFLSSLFSFVSWESLVSYSYAHRLLNSNMRFQTADEQIAFLFLLLAHSSLTLCSLSFMNL